jgi:murein DD-endopeptidase MepM/ murein hydrolase activator NlpD
MKVFSLILIFCLISCGSFKSGKYVKLRPEDTLESIAVEFKVPNWIIQASNQGKNFKPGDWVFVPLNRGIMGDGYSSPFMNYSGGEFIWPVPSTKKVSSKFGKRWGKKHDGIDIPARSGSHILAVNDGVVVYSGNGFGGYGNVMILSHRYGFFSLYAHNKMNYSKKGETVHKGQVIAQVGSTGKSTGPHLHFEIRRDGRALNPKFIISKN